MENFDSKGFNTGINVKDIMQSLEMQFIANKKSVFERASKTNDFRMSAISAMKGFEDSNIKASLTVFEELKALIIKDIDNAFQYGEREVDRQINGYKEQGFKPQQEPKEKATSSIYKATLLSSAISLISGVIGYSISNVNRQIMTVVMQVNPNSDNLELEIDRVQDSFTNGIQGGVNRAGVEMSMGSIAELTTRNETFEATLTAQASRREEYGLNLIQISAHPSSCPLCLPWQTKVLVDNVRQSGIKQGNFELLSTAINSGLYHYNCRHTSIPYVQGYSNPNIFKYDKASNKETADRYAVEQLQRNNERNIRQYKIREAEALTYEKREQARQKVSEWQARQRNLKEIAEEKGLPFYRQYTREQVGGKTQPKLPPELFGY